MKIVLFHKNCNDGLFAAYSVWLKFKENIIYIPVAYKPAQDLDPRQALSYILNSVNQPEYVNLSGVNIPLEITRLGHQNKELNSTEILDFLKGIDLVMVDFCLPYSHFKEYCSMFKSVTILDHHKTAIDDFSENNVSIKDTIRFNEEKEEIELIVFEYGSNGKAIFASDVSGAFLTYVYLNSKDIVPYFIRLVSDRDMWTFKLKETNHFHSGMSCFDIKSFEELDELVNKELSKVLYLGVVLESVKKQRISARIKNGYIKVNILYKDMKYNGVFINSNLDIASDLGNEILTETGCDIAVIYSIQKELDVSCSVRSTKDIDSSFLSKRFGGGGHANASGFHINLNRLMKIFKVGSLEVKDD